MNGFLGTRGSLMLDVVFLAMFAVVPLLLFSIKLAKRQQWGQHKRMQVTLGVVLLVAVTAFELDMRFFTDWRARAAASPYFDAEVWCPVLTSLVVHLFFAIPTTMLWAFVIIQALRKFPTPPVPNSYSGRHKVWAMLATVGMLGTAVTGWLFYYLAFIA